MIIIMSLILSPIISLIVSEIFSLHLLIVKIFLLSNSDLFLIELLN